MVLLVTFYFVKVVTVIVNYVCIEISYYIILTLFTTWDVVNAEFTQFKVRFMEIRVYDDKLLFGLTTSSYYANVYILVKFKYK